MADDQTVIDHLLLGRQALERDVDRLNVELQRLAGAIEQLDAVIDMVGSSDSGAPTGRRTAPLTRSEAGGVTVNTSAAKAAARNRKPRGNAPKSIRVHVLEMLAAENREWSLSEIIDRIHAEGIQAHDDAVRSITIKLMKDGRVERIGRGQYRLTRRGSSRAAEASAPADLSDSDATDSLLSDDVLDEALTDETAVDDAGSDSVLSDDLATDGDAADTGTLDADTTTDDDTTEAVTAEGDAPAGDEAVDTDDETSDASDETTDSPPAESGFRPYTPPLNLGQPWR